METEAERLARIARNLARYKKQGFSREEIDAYIASEQTTPEKELAKEPPDEAPRAPLGDVMAGVGTAGAALLGGVPGGQRLVAGLRSLAPGISYGDALNDVRQSTGMLPAPARIGAAVVGGAATGLAKAPGMLAKAPALAKGLGALVKTPARAAATYGAAAPLLDADPDKGLPQRAVEGTLGALVAGGLVKGTEAGLNVARPLARGAGAMFTKGKAGATPDDLLVNQERALADEVRPMYDAAAREGGGRAATPAVRAVLDRPEVQGVIERLRRLRKFTDVADDDPRMVDAVYKSLSDDVRTLKKGGAVPSFAVEGRAATNSGRFAIDDLQQTQQDLVEALSTPGTRTVAATTVEAPAVTTAQSPPPTLREAIDRFQRQSAEVWRRNPGTETVAQRSARTALERHGAEDVVSPALRGSPPGNRTVETAPARTEATPPTMPSYGRAVETFAKGKGEQTATRRGANAIDLAQRSHTSGQRLGKDSPEALERWLTTKATPREREAFLRSLEADEGLRLRHSISPRGSLTALNYLARPFDISFAADRMHRATRGLPRGAQVPSGVGTSTLAALLEALRGGQ